MAQPIPNRQAAGSRATTVALTATLLTALLTALLVPSARAQRPEPTEPTGPGEPAEARFFWPLSPAPRVARPFDAPDTEYGPGHRGVDLAAGPGQEVLAAGAGAVVFAGRVAGRGVVSIDHDGHLRTTYEPVTPAVSAGEQVYQGQVIGTVAAGHPRCPAAACLHWGVRRADDYLDPMRLVRTDTRLRLKPWSGVPP